MTEEELINQIKPFTDACDNMARSKFIMIDKRVGDVLKAIASNDTVFSIIKNCMINFNFDNEWKLATARINQLQAPSEEHRFIAFVFSILSRIDDKRISASTLLATYFSRTENTTGAYAEFCDYLIIGFKEAIINKLLSQNKIVPLARQEANTLYANKELLSRLAFLSKDLKEYVQGLKKVKKSSITKGELIEIINNLFVAIKNEHVAYIKAFVLAIKAGHGKDKEIERRLVEIIDIVSKFE